jgi:hypothetical protein
MARGRLARIPRYGGEENKSMPGHAQVAEFDDAWRKTKYSLVKTKVDKY